MYVCMYVLYQMAKNRKSKSKIKKHYCGERYYCYLLYNYTTLCNVFHMFHYSYSENLKYKLDDSLIDSLKKSFDSENPTKLNLI